MEQTTLDRASAVPAMDGEKLRLMTLGDLDGRTASAKRARALVQDLESDLGGSSRVSAGQRELVTRAAVIGALVQDSEARMLTGEEVDMPGYLHAVKVQRQLLDTLGLDRRIKDVTPPLQDYIAGKARSA